MAQVDFANQMLPIQDGGNGEIDSKNGVALPSGSPAREEIAEY